MKVVTFVTEGSLYVKEVEKLQVSCDALGYTLEIRQYPDRGNWTANTCIKATALREALAEYKCDILYVDADAVIKEPVDSMWDKEFDIAVHYLERMTLLSGTIFLRNNARTRILLLAWEAACLREGYTQPDQGVLQRIIQEEGTDLGIRLLNIDYKYTKIFDLGDTKPAIEHHQLSRVVRMNEPRCVTPIQQFRQNVLRERYGNIVEQRQDGAYFLKRRHSLAESFLDKHYRRNGRDLLWFPIALPAKPLVDLPITDHVYMIGKGPSLDNITRHHLAMRSVSRTGSSDLVVCLNESIHAIEAIQPNNPLLAVQQDMCLLGKCRPLYSPILIHEQLRNWYSDVQERYEFKPVRGAVTAVHTILILKSLGVRSITLLAFDALLERGASTEYAKVIGHGPGTNPDRFAQQKNAILEALTGVQYSVSPVFPLNNPGVSL